MTCSSCNANLGPGALRVEAIPGWPAGEPQCLACMLSGIDRASLAPDEIDHELTATITKANNPRANKARGSKLNRSSR